MAFNDSRGLFESLLMDLPARWVNGWQGYQMHQTKPVQFARVAALGYSVPATLWTNDGEQLRAFAAQHPKAIFKPVQGGDETRRLTPAHLTDENLQALSLAPITVQAEIVGTNIRVFVAGERVFACEVRTPTLDYRQDHAAELLVHTLPGEMIEQSLQIARTLSLVWTGIDYRLTPDGQYVFLEANPSPMFLGFEAQTGLPLTAALGELLMK
jgi:glutathione synthase/RimK-type ligase-like ATP-grasp enzyme